MSATPVAVRLGDGSLPGSTDAPPSAEKLSEFATCWGEQYDSYLATEPGRKSFWSTGSRGLISYGVVGRHALVSGGLIAPPAEKRRLLREFLGFAARLRLRPLFFCISEEDAALFADAGLRITKLGEDAILDLGNLDFRGKCFEWVRRQVNYCRRASVVADEIYPSGMPPDHWQELLAEIRLVGEDSLSSKPQSRELKFFDGRLGEHELGRRRLFVARSNGGHGRIEGFVVCNPMLNGRRWSTEIYRHRSDAVRGTVPFLVHHLVLTLQEEGVEQINLCIVPGRNCDDPQPGDNPAVRWAFAFSRRHLGWVFDLAGLDQFKSRFRPRYENRYLCGPHTTSFGAFLATFRIFGVFRLSPRKTTRLLVNHLRKRQSRPSLEAAE